MRLFFIGLFLGFLPVAVCSAQTQKKMPVAPCVKSGEKLYEYVEQMPQFPGGEEAMRRFLASNFRVPAGSTQQGRVFIKFVIASDGHVCNPEVVKGVSPTLDKETLRVFSLLPAWYPGYQNGKAEAVSYAYPLSVPPAPLAPEMPAVAFDKVNQPPRFIVIKQSNGVEITESLKLRASSGSLASGHAPVKVPIRFVIDTTGNVTRVVVPEGPGLTAALRQRAEQTIYQMRWEPGQENGRKVPVAHQLSVSISPTYAAPVVIPTK